MNKHIADLTTKSNRPEKGGFFPATGGGSFRREGKKEGVWGRNFCLPALLSFGLAQSFHTRRPRFAGGRRGRELPRKLYHLRIHFLEIGSNFFVQAAPFEKLRFLRRGRPRFLQPANTVPKIRRKIAISCLERVTGIEPVSSAWKAEVMSHYTTPAHLQLFLLR